MIITLTPNPSVDRTIGVPALRRGQVHRADSDRSDAGGKGINVTRALALNGTASLAVLPVGGSYGRLLADLLGEAGITHRAVPIAGNVRSNVAIVEPDGTTTKVNERGPHLSLGEAEALLAAVTDALTGAQDWVVGCGSLPPGLGDDFYVELIRMARARGANVAIDSSGTPMRLAVAALPDLIKPNLEELEEFVDRPLPTVGDVIAAGRDLNRRGIARVIVSLGQDGAVLVTADLALHASARVERPVSTVGAGDAALAGFLHAHAAGASDAEALTIGVRFGSAAVGLPGSRMPSPEDVAAVTAVLDESPDPGRPLSG